MRSPSPRSFPSPHARYPDYRHRLPAPLRGREEAAVAAGWWGWFQRLKPCHGETQETGAGGAVSASPLPVSPSPTGVIPNRYSAMGSGSLVAVSPDTPERSGPRPWHGFPPPQSSRTCRRGRTSPAPRKRFPPPKSSRTARPLKRPRGQPQKTFHRASL